MSVTTEKKIVGVLGCVLMVYLIIRAYSIPLVHDESATFFFYVHNGKFLPQENGFDANNHFLNSVLSFCFYKLFGSSELSLRLASLIFFPVFVFYWFKFSQLIADTFLRWVFILTGLFTHNFIEFFALSRGYGMSMAILIAALWYFIIAFKEERRIFLLYGILLLLLALYANLALLNTIILMMGLLLGYFYWLKKRSPPREGYWYFPTAYKERRKNVR
ncbi:MAG: hypothetical protein IT235_08110, partial [Bacteroidia bacterium]|nr:hypothetical protein [Bacteroidia bacterium]